MEHLEVVMSHQFPVANAEIPHGKEDQKRCFISMPLGGFSSF